MSDLMELPEARAWWDTNAPTHRFDFEVIFNTSPTSRSMQNLQASLGRLEGKDGYWDRGPHVELYIEQGANLRTRRDWPPHVWEYRHR